MKTLEEVPQWLSLSREAQDCLSTTCRLLGKPVSFIADGELKGNEYGFSDIERGVPKVWLRPSQPEVDSTVIHELLHLQLRKMGFPVFSFWRPIASRLRFPTTPLRDEFLADLPNRICTTVEHFIMYREIRDKFPRYDPSAKLKNDMRQMWGMRISVKHPSLAIWTRALVFFQCGVELAGDPLLIEIADWFRQNGWTRELRLAKRMCAEVRRCQPKSPRIAVKCVVRCLNILLSGTNRCRLTCIQREDKAKRRAMLALYPAFWTRRNGA
jgi:hypothetical protein